MSRNKNRYYAVEHLLIAVCICRNHKFLSLSMNTSALTEYSI